MQEDGSNHAQSVGFSTDGSDVVEIETWCQSEGRIGTKRDWILKDAATGELIGRATGCISKLLSSLPSLCLL
ncbi:hypothetical protein V6N13_101099 [Hibiscus sabdariffa]|uniref:Acyl-[acyl-carrier-protein] hydrolase n=1 Tax=Hibiscus sabdariffa TaxID=183260 RepID=A0ABR2QKF2_9ROSI